MMEKRIIIWFIVAGLLGGVLLNGAAFAAGKHTDGDSGVHTDEHGTPLGVPGDPHKVDRTIATSSRPITSTASRHCP